MRGIVINEQYIIVEQELINYDSKYNSNKTLFRNDSTKIITPTTGLVINDSSVGKNDSRTKGIFAIIPRLSQLIFLCVMN